MKYHDKDGVNDITPADKEIIGSAIPKVTMGMTNTFRYKNVSLSVFLNAQLGQTANNWLYDVSHNSYRQNRLMVDFWTPENPTNKYPKNSLDTSVNPMSAGFYEKTDFLRVQDVTLAYRVPQRWLKKISLNLLPVASKLRLPWRAGPLPGTVHPDNGVPWLLKSYCCFLHATVNCSWRKQSPAP